MLISDEVKELHVNASNYLAAYSVSFFGQVRLTRASNWYSDAAYLDEEDQLLLHASVLAVNHTGEFTDLLQR